MNILITGASDGIGLEIAKILAEQHNKITLVARRKDVLERAATLLYGDSHAIIVADLTDPEDLHALQQSIVTNAYDVLINNAGAGMYGMFTEMPLVEQLQMLRLNILALTELSYTYLRYAKRGDALVNVSSIVGTTSYPRAAVYAASKAYVTSLSESLWQEYKDAGIYVGAFCPGATVTNFHAVAGGATERFPSYIMQTPQQVAHELVHALERRNNPLVVSGFMNRCMVFAQKFLSKKLVLSIMAGFGPLKLKK